MRKPILAVAVFLLTVFLLSLQAAWGGTIYGEVLKVLDGDTLDVQVGAKVERVRIYGIDAPERGEPHYKDAKEFTAKMTMDKEVKLLKRGRGYYGRLLAFVMVDGKSVGLELVRNGLARVYSNNFAPVNPRTFERYKKGQIHAMSGDFGIWGK